MTAKFRKIFPLFVLIAILFSALPAWAAFDLVVSPSDGGFDLRFGRIEAAGFKAVKQVTLRVTSDTGDQYRVKQRLIEPLRSGDGVELRTDQFQMYPLVSSNTRGSLLTFAETPVSSFDNVIYTSSATGEGDSFQVVYTFSPGQRQVPGSYRGRIAFVLVPVKSTASQVVVSMNVTVELTAGLEPVVAIVPEKGRGRLVLKSPEGFGASSMAQDHSAVLFINVLNPLGARYRIFQTFDGGEPTDTQGRRPDLSLVHVTVDGSRRGSAAPAATLKEVRGSHLLYTSDVHGAPVELAVRYEPDPSFWLEGAGEYRGRIKFFLEIDGSRGVTREEVKALDIYFDVRRLFDITVTSQGQEGVRLNFGDVSHKTGPGTSEVRVSAVSNLGQPYHIVQVVGAPMTNAEGEKVPEEDFTVRARQGEEGPRASFLLEGAVPVRQGETTVCISDASGHPSDVTLVYELKMRPDSKSGRYATQLGYSLVMK